MPNCRWLDSRDSRWNSIQGAEFLPIQLQTCSRVPENEPGLLAHVRQHGHEPGTLDGRGHGVLTDGLATALPPADDFALPVGQLLQEFQVLVVDIHWAGPFSVDKNGVFFLAPSLGLCLPAAATTCSCSCSSHLTLPDYPRSKPTLTRTTHHTQLLQKLLSVLNLGRNATRSRNTSRSSA